MRGFIGGIVFGTLAVGAGLVVLSVMSPVAPVPEVRSEAPAGTTGSTGTGEADVGRAGKDPQVVEMAPTTPSTLPAPGPAAGGDTEPAVKPESIPAPVSPAAPVPGATSAGVAVNGDSTVNAQGIAGAPAQPADPVTPVTPGETLTRPDTVTRSVAAPVAPEGGQAPVVTTTTENAPASTGAVSVAPPPAETAPTASIAPAGRPESATEMATASADASPLTAPPSVSAPNDPTPGATAPQVAAPASEPAPVVTTAPADPPPAAGTPLETVQPASDTPSAKPQVIMTPPQVAEAPGAIAAPQAQDTPIAVPATDTPLDVPETAPGDGPRVVVLTQDQTSGQGLSPRIGKRVVPLIQRDAESATEAPSSTEPQAEPDAPPLTRYAAPFDNPEGKPLMSIVLIDDDKAIGVEALSEFPYPLTFAVDPTSPDAAAKMARHRKAGFEVVALVNLPAASSAQDAEVALSVIFERVPQALAVLEGTGTGVQGNRQMSDQVSAFAGASGRGVITQGNGLNTMQKLAVKEGIPAAAVFRDFDGAGQTPTVMRRFLDQAAFRAGQEGAVVMLGRVRPDTISALLIWALQDRATRVALAPVSAVLKASVPSN